MYKKVGIFDVKEFYKDKFAFPCNFDFTNKIINCYDIDYFKFLWMYSNIKENTRVLDFGCGSGTLSCLKNKGCEVTGIDYSETALKYAKSINNYDIVHSIDLFEYDKYDYFDYVVSLDVFGHISFEDKDRTISQLKRFLRPGGTMLHGIECGKLDYSAMSEEELRKFIEVDGHVGIEAKLDNINRFKKFFKFVTGEVRYDIANSANEYIKQYTQYGNNELKSEVINYIKMFDENERRSFNIASGLIQIAIENQNRPSPPDAGGFLFLKASDNELKHCQMEIVSNSEKSNIVPLIENDDVFIKGWWNVEFDNQKKFRWSSNISYCLIEGHSGKKFIFEVFASYPKITQRSVEVFFINNKNNKTICSIVLNDNMAKKVNIPIHDDRFELQIFCDLTWIPNLLTDSLDFRELGIGICNVSIQ
ncbi:MAG: class I SAM-dependent methyltransferase [Crocosphaera sp.]|jgi:cyclopropane fatty-acyl-phospholipid synthase-like methyltransferase